MTFRVGAIAWKELRQMRRDRMTLAMMVVLPVMQLLLFGYAINTDVRHVPTVIFDQDQSAASRDLYRSLGMLGMPTGTMDAARRRAVMSPLRITAIGSAVTAAIVMLPLTGVSLIVAPVSLVVIAAVIAAGIGIVWLGLIATRPVLDRAAAAG